MKVTIYTDGGADPNPGIGGWAAILLAGSHEKVLTGNEPWTTNNRMELQAAVAALKALKLSSEVEIHTDSEYLRRGITEWISNWQAVGWQRKGKPIPNKDLWQALWGLTQNHTIEWHWVKGHSGDRLNERVDHLAREARLELKPEEVLPAKATKLFVRGTCKGNPGPGAWGVVLEESDGTEQISGALQKTTNNRMELQAVIEGLRMLEPGTLVYVVTMSDYVYMGATRWLHGWRNRSWTKKDGKPISNLDQWQELDRLEQHYDVKWISGKGQESNYRGLIEANLLAQNALKLEL